MPRIIATIEGEPITENEDGSVAFTAKAAIDTDGSGPLHGDPDAQADTTLHHEGKALNADLVPYIVVPPVIVHGVKGIVMGCQAVVTNTRNGAKCPAVAGDIGPHTKLGEISVACAKVLGINPSPTSGGEDEHVVRYLIFPGQPAIANGITYTLQPFRV